MRSGTNESDSGAILYIGSDVMGNGSHYRKCPELYAVDRTEQKMEVDYNPVELPINTVYDSDSDLEGTDVKDMRLEAEAVVNDVLFAVTNMFVSKTLPCAVDVAYINVEIKEGAKYCLELTDAGLRVVGFAFDQVDESCRSQYHETIYSLLDSLSPAYREAFGNALLRRLEELKSDGQS
ncbi:GSK3B-interacting protein [Bufo bufo]|uniref:GSK3B-interacting protein n=1 Tax=Bufo bufo TaxID=8384 RepID=UPI001ABED124|nr:GSK3B-interacting protein [Bufo bufo]